MWRGRAGIAGPSRHAGPAGAPRAERGLAGEALQSAACAGTLRRGPTHLMWGDPGCGLEPRHSWSPVCSGIWSCRRRRHSPSNPAACWNWANGDRRSRLWRVLGVASRSGSQHFPGKCPFGTSATGCIKASWGICRPRSGAAAPQPLGPMASYRSLRPSAIWPRPCWWSERADLALQLSGCATHAAAPLPDLQLRLYSQNR